MKKHNPKLHLIFFLLFIDKIYPNNPLIMYYCQISNFYPHLILISVEFFTIYSSFGINTTCTFLYFYWFHSYFLRFLTCLVHKKKYFFLNFLKEKKLFRLWVFLLFWTNCRFFEYRDLYHFRIIIKFPFIMKILILFISTFLGDFSNFRFSTA